MGRISLAREEYRQWVVESGGWGRGKTEPQQNSRGRGVFSVMMMFTSENIIEQMV